MVAALLVWAQCGPPERDPNVIEFWTLQLSPTFDDYLNDLIDRFEADHPGITIRWVDVPYDGITQKFLSSIASGRSPDVVNLPSDYLAKYVQLGALLPLDTLLADSAKADYLPAAATPLIFDGHWYGVPWYLSTQILIYDREKLREAGFDPDAPPRTYDALLDMARTYGERTGDYAFFYNLVVDSYLIEVLEAEGIPVVSEDGTRALFNTPEAAAVIEDWVAAFKAGVMPRESIAQGHRAALQLYQSGTIAMFIGGPQYLRIIQENAPSLYETTDVTSAITGTTGKKNLAIMSLVVSAKTANPEMAAKFAQFVTNGPNQLAFSKIVTIYPSVQSALEAPYFTELADSTLDARARFIAASQLDEAELLKPALPNYNRLLEVFKAHLLKAFTGDKTVQKALDDAADDWNKILAEQW